MRKLGFHADTDGDNHTVVVTTEGGGRVEITREDAESAVEAVAECDAIPTDAAEDVADRVGVTVGDVWNRLTDD